MSEEATLLDYSLPITYLEKGLEENLFFTGMNQNLFRETTLGEWSRSNNISPDAE